MSSVGGVSVRYYQSDQGTGCACDKNLQYMPKKCYDLLASSYLYTWQCTTCTANIGPAMLNLEAVLIYLTCV